MRRVILPPPRSQASTDVTFGTVGKTPSLKGLAKRTSSKGPLPEDLFRRTSSGGPLPEDLFRRISSGGSLNDPDPLRDPVSDLQQQEAYIRCEGTYRRK
ncbi:hypothetical protein PCASD_03153 [Puccinia coronata f. sp. avenae]|uniref:Uncharacterized protein n=1 Tax=Puccinia coronata f. sp. avenae TaxID=200324 RepID=A0A2N5VFH5_9BASI|nr:hypothetical protein PCASD_03153 [Puccinia coronata f. sp. avenae]